MHTIEQAAELHAAIAATAPHPGALLQTITPARGLASNQAAYSLCFSSRVGPREVHGRDLQALQQGFGCVQIDITARWGGAHPDGRPRAGTEIGILVLDRLQGGMAQRIWCSNRNLAIAKPLSPDEVIPLLRELLGLETLEVVRARAAAAQREIDARNSEWEAQWGKDE